MFELTNEQRRCFALPLVLDSWRKVKLKASPHDDYITYAYLDGNKIVKVIMVSDKQRYSKYVEFGVDETLSADGTKILPKTDRGQAQGFTAANLVKKTPVGMALSFDRNYVAVVNNTSEQYFYRSDYNAEKLKTLEEFSAWVDNWCLNTKDKELWDIEEFAKRGRIHQRFKEGDFFRFRINRSLFGYGRIIVDYGKMRKEGIPFWNVFFGKPLCVAVYHIATEDTELSPSSLVKLKMLPSQMIMDNIFYYGECEIIGNLPIEQGEDNYTIHYGKGTEAHRQNYLHYMSGKTYVSIEYEKEAVWGNADITDRFSNKEIGWAFDFELPILLECIKKKSNKPYWNMIPAWKADQDLRNPKFKKELKRIKKQMGIK